MKKLLIFIFSGLLLALSACGTGGSAPTVTAVKTAAQTTITETGTTEETSTAAVPETTVKHYGTVHQINYLVENDGESGYITGETSQILRGTQASSEVVATAKKGYVFYKWSDGVTTPARSGDVITEDVVNITALFIAEVEDVTVPTITITTESGMPVETKNYERATVVVSGTSNGKFDGTFMTQIKGRGNSSWESGAQNLYTSKNSYRLKLDESQKFLGIGDSKNRDWVLNSCKFDASLLRNWIGYRLGDMLDGIDYSPECSWAYLYINGDYRGVYLITEHPEVAKDRVDVDETTEQADNGFMLELDMRGNLDGIEGIDYFYVDGYAEGENNPREWVIKSKLSSDSVIAAAQFEFIKNYIQEVHNTIEGGNRNEIEKLIDTDSFIDMLIISEFTKNVDVNTASMYLYKQAGGKLCFTCPWDFDFGFGTYGVAVQYEGMVTDTRNGNQWFQALIGQKWFAELVNERINEIEPLIKRLISETTAMGIQLQEAADSNADKWNLWGQKYHGYVSSGVSKYLESYGDHLEYLNDWMTNRWEIMKACFEYYLNPNYVPYTVF